MTSASFSLNTKGSSTPWRKHWYQKSEIRKEQSESVVSYERKQGNA